MAAVRHGTFIVITTGRPKIQRLEENARYLPSWEMKGGLKEPKKMYLQTREGKSTKWFSITSDLPLALVPSVWFFGFYFLNVHLNSLIILNNRNAVSLFPRQTLWYWSVSPLERSIQRRERSGNSLYSVSAATSASHPRVIVCVGLSILMKRHVASFHLTQLRNVTSVIPSRLRRGFTEEKEQLIASSGTRGWLAGIDCVQQKAW